MITGTIVLIPFPFSELTNIKVRPALVVCETKDKHRDLMLCAISSVIPDVLGDSEILLQPDKVNKLRVRSVIKVDRIMTLKQGAIIATLGSLTASEAGRFKQKIIELVN